MATSDNSYDQLPYAGRAFVSTHPDTLAVVGALAGMTPAPVEQCCVLELGCAVGGNLVPMAASLPGSMFLGLDGSSRQIAAASGAAAALDLCNVAFFCQDVLAPCPDPEPFDYIVCHGVYSWVPEAVQSRILQICREQLAPSGIAYISYNTYPGWHLDGQIREMIRYHDAPAGEPAARIAAARALLAFLAASTPRPGSLYHGMLREEIEGLANEPDWYLFHEYLEADNRPIHFHEFMARAEREGLAYLGEAELWPRELKLPDGADEVLAKLAPDTVVREQYLDYLRGRAFRRTLLRRADAPVAAPNLETVVMAMRAGAQVRPKEPVSDLRSPDPQAFETPQGATITTNHPVVKTALAHLGRRWPHSVPLAVLWQTVRAELGEASPAIAGGRAFLADAMRRCHEAGIVELHVFEPRFTASLNERPLASPVARWQALGGDGRITNLRHRTVELDAFDRLVLARLDGTRDRSSLLAWLEGLARDGALPAEAQSDPAATRLSLEERLAATLDRLASSILLLA